ncbi:MAG TPA: ABC transporter permease [Bryobacteraceae bacterium]|nr:ABC transporter permease [Bryobacteraceae bacterium]
MTNVWRDVLQGFRRLAKSPGFAAAAVATLALGIGANTAIFSVINEVLLNPAGVSKPAGIVAIRARYEKLALNDIRVSARDFADAAESTNVFQSAAMELDQTFNYAGLGAPERLSGAGVTYRWFEVFGARPHLGRAFQPEEDQPNANRVAVLSYAAWKRLFGGDAGVLGRIIELDQIPYRVIGVMGQEFRWPARVDVWVPLGLPPDQFAPQSRFNERYTAFARMRSGVTLPQASAWMAVLTDRVKNGGDQAAAFAKSANWSEFAAPFTDFIAGDTKTPMLVLLGAVGFVLLIACSNIAGLMLARASGRVREAAVRAALGASRWDLIRQTLAESLLLALAGAGIGLGVAFAGIRALLLLAPQDAPVSLDVRLDATVLLFTILVTVAAGVLFALAPAWQMSRMARYDALKDGGRSATAGAARQRLRSALVAGEVALALLLLAGAGLLLRSLAALENVNPGFQPDGVVTAGVTLPRTQYADPAKQAAFYRAVLDGLSNLPGVTVVAAGEPIPFSRGNSASFQIEDKPTAPGDPGPHGDLSFVTPGYFAALRIPVRAGRIFAEQDTLSTSPVAVIDETLARQYWPGEDPVGKRIRQGRQDWVTIVGVVGHVKASDLSGEDVKGRYYFSLYQRPIPLARFAIRSSLDPVRLASGIRTAVQAVDPAQPVSAVREMSDMVSASLAPRRFVVTLLEIFAGLALLMAALGLYGVIGYSVAQRTPEIGIRMALGARPGEVMGLVLRQGLRLTIIGAIAGLAASLAISAVLRGQLFHVSPFDPLTFIIAAAVLMGASALASYLPARRAARVDPTVALRYE